MDREELYSGREQTLVKHFILQKYLERFAHIVGSHWNTLTYVDCFSGPWNVRSHKFEDSSFHIALQELRKARDTHALKHRHLLLRAFFLEKDPVAYLKLDSWAKANTDVEICTRNAALEESVNEILKFIRDGRTQSFPFIFIDPTGWTGFGMESIAQLLGVNPGEVLINFMTGHIRRFIDSPQSETQESFMRLFGSSDFRDKIQGLAQQDREDAAISEYTRSAKQVGNFSFAGNAIVLHPEINRTHFNLIYLTRHPEGLKVFKEAEKKAMEVQEAARAEAKQRKRVTREGQPELFSGRELHDPIYYESLRSRYLEKSRDLVLQTLKLKQRLIYDEAWALALSQPMTWESDLKEWIGEWKEAGKLDVRGMHARQRIPHRNENNYLIWKQ